VTCIVAVEHEGEVWMGGDSFAGDDSRDFFLSSSPKVFVREGVICGCSGGFRETQVLQYCMDIPGCADSQSVESWLCKDFVNAFRSALRDAGAMSTKDGAEDLLDGFAALVGYRGEVYTVEPNFGVVRSTRGYETLGCGAKYALGNLFSSQTESPEIRVRRALEAAEAHNAGVKGPFTIVCTR
jgi:ATP-dependent protease HslVU (ClpYQ) peptidase subunit